MGDILALLREGITVNIAFDTESAIILGVVLFVALIMALAFYGKIIKP